MSVEAAIEQHMTTQIHWQNQGRGTVRANIPHTTRKGVCICKEHQIIQSCSLKLGSSTPLQPSSSPA
jgi:hypothetical protein